jgi:hypothetical protein
MVDRRTVMTERNAAAIAGTPAVREDPRALPATNPASPSSPPRPRPALENSPRRPPSKFGAAAEGWDAYNSWLDRVRQPTPPSRQAVIAKSLYSVSSYKNWADKARGAFDGPGKGGSAGGNSGGAGANGTGAGKNK